MPSKYRLRRIFKPLIGLLAKGLSKIGITPNIATCLMLMFSIFSAFSLIFFSNLILFSFFVFLTGIFDGIDGAIARLTNKTSLWGGVFDSVMDRISEFLIFLALMIYCWENMLWNLIDTKLIIIISYLCSLMISYLRARAEVIFKGDFDFGLMARSERLFYIVMTMILVYFFGFINEFLFIFMILVLATAIYRFVKIYKMIKEYELKEEI